MNIKPLGKVTALLADLGLEVNYAYDDLVFVQDSAFLIQFTWEPSKLKLFINSKCDLRVANEVAANISHKFKTADFNIVPAGRYFITPNEDETLNIEFKAS